MSAISTWTPDRDAELRRLWSEGRTVSQIQAAMSLTKGQVIGRTHRLGLPTRTKPLRGKPSGRPAQAQEAMLYDYRISAAGRCRFIAGEVNGPLTLCCGKPADRPDGSWCAEHRAIVFDTRPLARLRRAE